MAVNTPGKPHDGKAADHRMQQQVEAKVGRPRRRHGVEKTGQAQNKEQKQFPIEEMKNSLGLHG
jgi:hypothetical protein